MKIEQFNELAVDVFNWNAVARNNQHVFGEKAVLAQSDYIHEELKETLNALMKNDVVEVLDGVADVFVTLVYKDFLLQHGAFEFGDMEPILPTGLTEREHFYDIINLCSMIGFYGIVDNDPDRVGISIELLFILMNLVEEIYDVDMYEVTKNVMESNWSKYLGFTEGYDYNLECRAIEEARGMKDVGFNTVEVAGKTYVVFRNANGTGKIMKPLSYTPANPGQFLPVKDVA